MNSINHAVPFLIRMQPHASRRGTAMVAALTVIMTISVLCASMLSSSLEASKREGQGREIFRLNDAADSAINLAVHRIWSGYLAAQGGRKSDVGSIRAYMDALGAKHVAAGEEGVDITELVGLPDDRGKAERMAGVPVDVVRLSRTDRGNSIDLAFEVTTSHRGADAVNGAGMSETVREVFTVGAGDWEGLDYAMLANNINCIMCHANIDSADRFHNSDDALNGTFARVKIGALEEIMLRSSAESSVAGTLYVRGKAFDKAGAAITDWAAQTLKSVAMDDTGKIQEDIFGNLVVEDLVPAGDVPADVENLYVGLDDEAFEALADYVPTSFPAPFPDVGGIDPDTGVEDNGAGNRVVDSSEFAAVAALAYGSLAGGEIHVISSESKINSDAGLASAMGDGLVTSLTSETHANVVLVGTEDNPILLNGTIAIEGDLIIQGVVKGEGTLMVSGNVYLPTDLTYADLTTVDGARSFGIAADGTSNALAIASGGSIMVGDLFYKKPKKSKKGEDAVEPAAVTGDESGSFGFVLSEVALFNRGEWARTQAFLPGSGDDPSDPGSWSVANADYEAAYVPRYYVFTDDGTIPIYNKGIYYDGTTSTWVGKEHPGSWDANALSYAYPSDPTDALLYNADGSPRAAVHSLTSMDGWLSDELLASLMRAATNDHAVGEALKVDGLLYSNNSIFGIVSKTGPMGGQMEINGSIVAADVGLLIPGSGGVGLQLNYDSRGKGLLHLSSDEDVVLVRKLVVPNP